MYEYQEKGRYFAQVPDEVKEPARAELLRLGAEDIRTAYRGIDFAASVEVMYAVNFRSRLLSRVLAPLISFNCRSADYLYKKSREIPWEDFLDPGRTFAVSARVSGSAVKHSRFAALRVKDAVADRFRDRTGRRPSVDQESPDTRIDLHVENHRAVLSLDASGGSLHRQGYRQDGVEAPMSETLAAAVVAFSGWDGRRPLHDPFCGSGTILCESYLRAGNIPAGFLRERFGFESFPDFDRDLWARVRAEAWGQAVPVREGLITGSDISSAAVSAASANAARVSAAGGIRVERRDIFDIPGLEETAIVCNPPYGIRLERGKDLCDFYRKFGDFLKRRCRGATACVYFGKREYLKSIGLRPAWKRALRNGPLDGRLAFFELY